MKTKKFLAVMLSFAIALSLFAVTAAAAVELVGDGSPESPYQIGTDEELLEFAKRVTDGEVSLCAKLTANITVSEWTTIGVAGFFWTGFPLADSPTPYAGTFDGGGYTLTLTRTESGEDAAAAAIALFNTIDTNGVVKNLNLYVQFSGWSWIAGVAAKNYGTIECVTVDGTITAGNAYAGGIAVLSGCKFVDGVLAPGKIQNCLNRASVTGTTYVGGIAGSFLGEMRYCGNVGTITGNQYFGGLLSPGANINPSSQTIPVERRFIVSDCYNAGQVVSTNQYSNYYFASLLGGEPNMQHMAGWRDEYSGEFEDFQVSGVFAYGGVSGTADTFDLANSPIITTMVTSASSNDFTPSDITNIFSNTYYLEGIGGTLFIPNSLNGPDGLGTALVKNVIKSKSTAEFASADMAALLNNERSGADAPWEFVVGNQYPTLKAASGATDPTDPPPTDPDPDAAAITVGAVTGYQGASVTVPVSIAGNPGFYAFSFQLTYNTSALELEDLTPGGVVSGKGTFTSNVTGGIATFNANSTDADITGNGVLFNAKFKIKAGAAFMDYPITVALNSGSNKNFVSADETNPPVSFTAGTVAAVDNAATGDADGDGAVTASDILIAVEAVSKIKSPTAEQTAALDMDKDGAITATDILLIAKKAVGSGA